MPKPDSLDLRRRVLGACDKGRSTEKVANDFTVSPRWVYVLLAERKRSGRVAPLSPSGGPKLRLAVHRERIRALLRDTPNPTLQEIHQTSASKPASPPCGAL